MWQSSKIAATVRAGESPMERDREEDSLVSSDLLRGSMVDPQKRWRVVLPLS